MQWFVDDVGKPSWGVDVLSPTFKDDLESRVFQSLENTKEEMNYITQKQDELYKLSLDNVNMGLQTFHF